MALTKYYMGDLLELTTEVNSDNLFTASDVMGMTITKEIIPTKANVKDTDLKKFLVVHPREFIFNPRTHGKKIGFGFNNTNQTFLISWNNIAFRVKKEMEHIVLPEFLFLHYNRSEWDREACFRSWGSSTEVFSWNSLCEMQLELPSLEIQQKYVAIYNSMIENQKCYERGLEDLKLTCDAYIEDLRRKTTSKEIGSYLSECDEKNTDLSVTLTQGVDVNMQFIPAKREAADKESTRIVRTGQFAFNKVVKSNGTKLPFALRKGPDCIISGSYQVFEVKDKEQLLPEYLMLWMARPETMRRCGFNAWGSTRDVFPFSELCKLKFPIPDINVQKAIADIYNVYVERKEINEKLKTQIKDICPVLIKGALEEGA